MAGKKGNKDHANKTSFTKDEQKGNKNAEFWDYKCVKELFADMLEVSISDDEMYCLQDVIHSVGLYRTGMDYLISKFPVFGNTKKDIQNVIIARMNKLAFTDRDKNPAIAIWRMKQLGEKDTQYQNIDQNVKQTIDKETADFLKKLDEKLT